MGYKASIFYGVRTRTHWCGLLNVRYVPIANKLSISENVAMGQEATSQAEAFCAILSQKKLRALFDRHAERLLYPHDVAEPQRPLYRPFP